MPVDTGINLRRVTLSALLTCALLSIASCKAPEDSPGSAVEPADASTESAAATQSTIAQAPDKPDRS